ncbi:MAG: 4Fe-4S dicluster domain-containing protein [Pseudomonadota bacterium]
MKTHTIGNVVICPCLGLSAEDINALGQDRATLSTIQFCDPARAAEAATYFDGDALICCSEDITLFETLAEDFDRPVPPVLDLRRRAGWGVGAETPLPKLAALIAEALLPAEPAKSVDVVSQGLCLIVGPAAVTIPAAEALAPYLSATVLLEPGEDLPDARGYEVILGRLRRAQGALGQFELVIDAFQQPRPGGIGVPELTVVQDGAQSGCDVILDLRGERPLFPAHEKREGYLRADPKHPPSVAAAVLAASHLTGTFEKPLYVRTDPLLCAHSRAEQTGCTRCLDLCPTGAIEPSGDHVSVDPMICAGCGACSSACPSGAIAYDAPAVDLTIRRVQTLATVARKSGARALRLLVHDTHGAAMIRAALFHGASLPADVIPLEMSALGAFGHAEALAAIAAGFGSIVFLPSPAVDRDALAGQVTLAQMLAGDAEIEVLETTDPEVLVGHFEAQAMEARHTPTRPIGTRRQVARQAARALNPAAEQIALPTGAPFGSVDVNTDACTLCLSCVALCPSGALGDNADMPQLRFQEDACLQCGICVAICPETALSLVPRMDLTDAALTQRVLHEEEPFPCISCGKLFGSKSTIDRITEKLTGHAMFADESRLAMIKMCDDCRVSAQALSQDNPFASAERPRPRTTDDYLSTRKDH